MEGSRRAINKTH